MHSFITKTLALLSVTSIASAYPSQKRGSYPFSQLVAYGDELSDNGNGSYAHGITNLVYDFGTWTNGPVAVTYLAGLLGMPLNDYAFGSDAGGGAYGATINNRYTPAAAQWNGKPVPSVHQQIVNYTSSKPADIQSSMQFMWVGTHDLSEHADAFWLDGPDNQEFYANISQRITHNAEYLIEQGAPYVFVVNIYPKQLAPTTIAFLCPDGSCVTTQGQIIQNANTAIHTSLSKSKYSSKFIYHDVYGFLINVMDNKDSYGLTAPLTAFCDGDGQANWDACVAGQTVWDGAKKYFWLNWAQPTTTVHQLIAQDMKNTIDKFFGQ